MCNSGQSEQLFSDDATASPPPPPSPAPQASSQERPPASRTSISAADYSKLPLQIDFEQLPQHGTISSGVQATPSGRQNWAPALAPQIDGVKKAPAAINNAPTSFNNEVFFISFLLPIINMPTQERLRRTLSVDT
jgi:hypothetical protein